MTANLSSIAVQATTLGDLLLQAAKSQPDRDAFILPHRRRTFAELQQGAWQRALSLQALGVGAGDHVGLLLPTSVDFVESLFAIALLGAVTVPVNARYQPPELAYLIENADLKVLITTDKIAEAVNFVERLNKALPGLAAADAGKEAFAKAQEEIAAQLDEARGKAVAIISAAEKRAAELGEESVTRARNEAESIIDSAREEVFAELNRARQTLRSEVADIAMLAAEQVVEAELDASRHTALIEGIVNKGFGNA